MSILKINLRELAQEIHNTNIEKGFWTPNRNMGELIMLIVTELSEALEAHRKGKLCTDLYSSITPDGDLDKERFEQNVKDTFQDEIADTAIRILDYLAYINHSFSPNKLERINEITENTGETLLNIVGLLVKVDDSFYTHMKAGFLNIALLSLQDIADKHNFDLLMHIKLKLLYNKTRQHLHGKKY